MELVRFYACAGDPVAVALRLVLKAGDQALQVCGRPADLQRLSAALWNQGGFLPHAGPQAAPRVWARSRLRLSDRPPAEPVGLLLNLGLELPEDLAVQRLFELVGAETEQRDAGRRRYRAHLAAGRQPETVQVAA